MAEVLEKPAAEAASAAAPAQKLRVVQATTGRRALRETARQDWVFDAEAGTTVEDVLDPGYWAHVAADMAPYARIEVLLETGEWMLDLVVLGAGRNWLKVKLLNKFDLEPLTETLAAADRFSIEWKGPHHRYAVIRKVDQQMVQSGFQAKGDASAWLSNHERVTAS